MRACSFIHGGRKIASDLLRFSSMQAENNTERAHRDSHDMVAFVCRCVADILFV